MPEGFEQNASTTDVNDLWAFFKTLQSPPKKLEGNTPAVVAVLAEGNVVLPASTAEIYGGDITFELTFQNIGYWHNRNDIVRWRINSSTSRNVQVWGEWACDDSAAGGSFQIEGTQPSLQGVVGTTGGWDRYNLVPIGVAVISEGASELVVRPAEDLKSAMVDLRAIHLVAVGGVPLATGMVRSSGSENKKIKEPSEIAAALLDDAVPAADREKLIADSLKQAAEIIPLMAKGLPPEAGSKEEYRRIPWIWRVAIAAGKSGDNDLIRSVLIVSLPQKDQRLEHWQAVVIGGGLINGIGLVGHWPREGLTALVESDPSLAALWQRSLELSLPMSDDETVLFGTRYDALRMVAMQDWAVAGPQLSRYLEKGLDEELHMGAISGLSDLQHSDVAGLLISNFNSFSSVNRNLTIDALLRTPDRRETTIKALNDGQLPNELKQDERIVKLLKGSLR